MPNRIPGAVPPLAPRQLSTATAPTPAAPATAPATAPTGFAPQGAAQPVAGVGAAAAPPAPPLPPLTGTAWEHPESRYTKGTVYDAQLYFQHRLGLLPAGELRLFHHAPEQWGTPEVDINISTRKSGGVFGKGFYTSTRPETGYGKQQFQLALPMQAWAGKRVLECSSYTDGEPLKLPPGVDVLVYKSGAAVWVIFKPGSEFWVNRASTESNFDGQGKTVAWD